MGAVDGAAVGEWVGCGVGGSGASPMNTANAFDVGSTVGTVVGDAVGVCVCMHRWSLPDAAT